MLHFSDILCLGPFVTEHKYRVNCSGYYAIIKQKDSISFKDLTFQVKYNSTFTIHVVKKFLLFICGKPSQTWERKQDYNLVFVLYHQAASLWPQNCAELLLG